MAAAERTPEYDGSPVREGAADRPRAAGAELSLHELVTILRRRWWLIGLFVVLMGTGAMVWEMRQPAEYSASVLLRKEQPMLPRQLLSLGPGDDFSEQAVAPQVEVLKSRAVLGPVVDSLGLQLVFRDPSVRRSELLRGFSVEPGAPRAAYRLERGDDGRVVLYGEESGRRIAAAGADGWLRGPGFRVRIGRLPEAGGAVGFRVLYKEQAVDRLRAVIRFSPVKETTLLEATYTDADPATAAAVVGGLADAYQAHSARRARDHARRRREFLSQQLARARDSLRYTQEQMLGYQEQSGTLDPAVEGEAMLTRLLTAQGELRMLRHDETILEALTQMLDRSRTDEEALRRAVVLGQSLVPAAQSIYGRLRDLQTERSRLTSNRFGYTETGAKVEVLDSLISETKLEMTEIVEQSLQALRSRRQAAESRVRELRTQVNGLPARSAGFVRHRQQVMALQRTVDLLAEKYYESQISEAVASGNVEVVDPPHVPMLPDATHTSRRLLLAVLLGMMMGAGASIALEYLDSSVRDKEDAENTTGLSVIGVVPEFRPGAVRMHGRVGLVETPDTPGAEAFRTLRTMLRFARSSRPGRIVVTSPVPSDGKSSIASNLAVVLAQDGTSVLLVDADLRRPTVHRTFELDRQPGVTDIVAGDATLDDAVVGYGESSLSLLPCGAEIPHPAEFLSAGGFEATLEELSGRFDAVIIDTPPILAVTDTVVMASMVDAMLVVARSNQTDRSALGRGVEQLRRVDAPLLGVVLNGVAAAGSYKGYGGHYYNSYYTRSGLRPRRRMRNILETMVDRVQG